MKIGLSENPRTHHSVERYIRWIHRVSPSSQIVALSYHLNNLLSVETCDGLILTGGGDVHPKYYSKSDIVKLVERVDEERDKFEFKAAELALRAKIPLLGICRGLQVMNVVLGGSLLPDIEKSGDGYNTHLDRESDDCRHPIIVEVPSLLSEVVGVGQGEVGTQHHQAADRVAKELRVGARSEDGIVEALEWADPARQPFLLLVQWHPERMSDFGNPFSRNILQRFINAAESAAQLRNVR